MSLETGGPHKFLCAIKVTFLLLVLQVSLSQSLKTKNDCMKECASKDYHIEQVTKELELLEAPHWVPEEQALYFVDISGHGVHRYQPYTKQHTWITLNDLVTAIIPIKDRKHEFIIGYGRKISLLRWDGISNVYTLYNKFEIDRDKKGNRFNEGKADHQGGLFIGTMGEKTPFGEVVPKQGSLFRVSKTCKLDKVLTPVSISNGIGWNLNNNVMYYIDTTTRRIDSINFNYNSGKITKRETLFDFASNNITGSPDGMTVDAAGNLWIAVWGGSRVIQVSPKGKLLRSVWMPVERITSVAWGGTNFDILFVTTMQKGLTSSELKKQPTAGALFAVTGLPARGIPANTLSSCYVSLRNIK